MSRRAASRSSRPRRACLVPLGARCVFCGDGQFTVAVRAQDEAEREEAIRKGKGHQDLWEAARVGNMDEIMHKLFRQKGFEASAKDLRCPICAFPASSLSLVATPRPLFDLPAGVSSAAPASRLPIVRGAEIFGVRVCNVQNYWARHGKMKDLRVRSHGIHAAAVHGREDVIDILIRHGANPSGLSMLPQRVLTDAHLATFHLMLVYMYACVYFMHADTRPHSAAAHTTLHLIST